MRGNALKHIVETRRYSAAEYHAAVPEVISLVRQVVGQAARVSVIPAYRTKADFGDMDVLVESSGYDTHDFRARLLKAFRAPDLVANGSVYSVPHGDLQVDLISASPKAFDFCHGYFSFNDLGNLIGRTAHKQGMSFGHDGLRFALRDGDYKFRDITVTRDFDEALDFLGYDAPRFSQGFDVIEEIFDYVADGDYFNRDIYLLDNRNAVSRIRDSKRKTYMEFLRWCEETPSLPAFAYPGDKSVWIPRIRQRFADFGPALDAAEADLAVQRAVKSKFSGEYVRSITGLDGKELGGLMQRIRESFPDRPAMQSFVLASDDETVKAYVFQMREVDAAAPRPVRPRP